MLKRLYEKRLHVRQTCITRREAAKRLGVKVAWVRRMEQLGVFLTTKVGRRWLVPVSELAYMGEWR
jgi:excisionase family DNA binding protein